MFPLISWRTLNSWDILMNSDLLKLRIYDVWRFYHDFTLMVIGPFFIPAQVHNFIMEVLSFHRNTKWIWCKIFTKLSFWNFCWTSIFYIYSSQESLDTFVFKFLFSSDRKRSVVGWAMSLKQWLKKVVPNQCWKTDISEIIR